jgi:hypothetical protein
MRLEQQQSLREQAQADKMAQMAAWAQSTQNPENILRLAQAKAFQNTKGTTFDGGLIDPKLKGVPIPVSELPTYLARIAAGQGAGAGAGGGVGRGMASLLRGVLTTSEGAKIDALPSALAAHNRLVDVLQAYNASTGDAGLTTRLLQQWAAKDPSLSALAQRINGDPSKLSSVYNSTARQLATEQFKIVNGSSAMPSEGAILDNMKTYPTLGDTNAVAAEKLNTLIDTQIRPAMMGPIGRLEAYKDPSTGAYPVKLYGDVHQNLADQLSAFGSKIHSLSGVAQDAQGNIQTGLIPPGGPGPLATPPQPKLATSPGPGGTAPAPGADPLAKHKELAATIMADPHADPDDLAWAKNFAPATAPAAPVKPPVPIPPPQTGGNQSPVPTLAPLPGI